MRYLLLILLLGISHYCHAQPVTFPAATTVVNTNINYSDFATVGNRLYAVNDSGQIVVWDLKALDTVKVLSLTTPKRYTAIARDFDGHVYAGTNFGGVYRIDNTSLDTFFLLKSKYYIYRMNINRQQKLTLIVPYAIYDPISKRLWYKFNQHASGIAATRKVRSFPWLKKHEKYISKHFSLPDYTYLDKNDIWWIWREHGEFGSDIEIFDTKYRKIATDTSYNRFLGKSVHSIFDGDSGSIYITCGLQHLSVSGAIYRVKQHSVTQLFDARDTLLRRPTKPEYLGEKQALNYGPAIGAGAFNHTDHKLYFDCDDGFYRATVPDTGKIQTFEPLFKNYSMSPIRKVSFTDYNQLIFLTETRGFGFYDGKNLVFFQ